MPGSDLAAPFVVPTSLLAPVNAAHGQHIWLAEMRVRFGMLELLVLDDESVMRIEGIDRKSPLAPVLAGVADQPLERVLRFGFLAEQLVRAR